MPVSAFLTGLYNKLNSTNDLKTALSSRFYFGNAPQNTTSPYLVYHLITDQPDWDFGNSLYEEYTIQFDIVSKSSSPSELTTLIGYLESLMDNTSFTITGYSTIKTFREMSTIDYSYEDLSWYSQHRYRILVKKT